MVQRLTFRFATPDDCSLLAQLNRQLIQDEGHRNQMTLAELAQRMRAWISGEYQAVIFQDAGRVVAYGLYKEDRDEIHLRQFLSSGITAVKASAGAPWKYSALKYGPRERD